MRNYLLLTILYFYINAVHAQKLKSDNALDYIPQGFVLFDTISGDLNGDKINDIVLIIKSNSSKPEFSERHNDTLDFNRRGIIVLIKKKKKIIPVLYNTACFASENEDGGVYFPPELYIEIKDNRLHIGYFHGRYGSWKYIFKYHKYDFQLTDYENTYKNHTCIENNNFDTFSINFTDKNTSLTTCVGTDDNQNEIFQQTLKNITILKTVYLSEITDFIEFNLDEYYFIQ